MSGGQYLQVGKRNYSISRGEPDAEPVRAQRWRGDESCFDCSGVHTTAPPSATVGCAALAFLAAISSAFWRIRAAKGGI